MKYPVIRQLLVTILLGGVAASMQIGDPGVTFDRSKFDPNYPQMEEWMNAGARGGIPLIDSINIRRTLQSGAKSSQINAAIIAASNEGGGGVLLENGTYDIDSKVSMKSGVSLIGESRRGVQCIINSSMSGNNGAFEFLSGVRNSGLYRMTIRGGWGTPRYKWNMSIDGNNELPGNENISVFVKGATDCWIDDCDILDSADFPVRIAAFHITVRNCRIDGVFNKHGGAHGYFFILDGSNLVTGCQITHLRHISLQGDDVRYNVIYDNDFAQEISFHSGDDGDNLIENNRIHLPADMPDGTPNPNYYAIMGPWSSKHQISTRPNYLYRNDVIEFNHGGARPWSDPDVVYYGPHKVRPADPYTNFTPYSAGPPSGGTLYPVVLGDPIPVENVSISPEYEMITVGSNLEMGVTVLPPEASNKSLIWHSDQPSIASVDSSGKVFGVAPGIATISTETIDGGFMDESEITVIPSTETVHILKPTDDAYIQGQNSVNNPSLRVEKDNRVSYLKFDLGSITGEISRAELELTVGSDAGNGQIVIDRGNDDNWTEADLTIANAPTSTGRMATRTATYALGGIHSWTLDRDLVIGAGNLSLIITHLSGNDVSFESSEGTPEKGPRLIITVPSSELDQWLSGHGLFDPDDDEDGDGHDNRAEFWFGTNPHEATSFATIRVVPATETQEGLKISFQSTLGRSYRIEASRDLKEPWPIIKSGIAGTGSRLDIPVGDGGTRQFYRVVVEEN